MGTIIVIGTMHTEDGACASEELYKIIEKISPEVIFCETSPEKLPQLIKATNIITPEINLIKRLIKEKSIAIVPVDLIENPFDKRLEAMFSLFKRNMNEYFCASSILLTETYSKGFTFLNSNESDKIFKDLEDMEKYFINRMKHQELSDFYLKWLKWNDKREDQWINLINNYFKIDKPKKAVFLVGAGHRFRLIDKIQSIRDRNELNSDWQFFPYN